MQIFELIYNKELIFLERVVTFAGVTEKYVNNQTNKFFLCHSETICEIMNK